MLLLIAGCARAPDEPAAGAAPGGPAAESEIPSSKPAFVGMDALSEPQGPAVTQLGAVSVSRDAQTPALHSIALGNSVIAEFPASDFSLAYHAVYGDREVIVGFAFCADPAPVCAYPQPVWVVLQAGRPAAVRRFANVFSADRDARVTADEDGVHVDLGLWDGARRRATLNLRNDVRIKSEPEPPRRATRADCRVVVRALDYCSRARTCGTFEDSSTRVPRLLKNTLSELFHTTTSLHAGRFVEYCKTSCRVGFTPSQELIAEDLCSGAVPLQWARSDLGWLASGVYPVERELSAIRDASSEIAAPRGTAAEVAGL